MKARSVFWTAATVRRRRADGDRVIVYLRRYFVRMLVGLALVAPLLIVATYQLAPGRSGRAGDDLVRVAVASDDADGSLVADGRARLATAFEADRQRGPAEPGAATAAPQPGPIRPVAWYRAAADEHGVSPYVLEALHQVESSAAPEGCLSSLEGSGTVGPFQFEPATFRMYGLDGNGDGVVDICGFADSLVSAANYLQALGADDDVDSAATRRALDRYGADADRVIVLARYYRARQRADRRRPLRPPTGEPSRWRPSAGFLTRQRS